MPVWKSGAALRYEHASADIKLVQVLDTETATATRFLGSPSVRLNGVDVENSARAGEVPGICCRNYGPADGPTGAPSVDPIRKAIREVTNLEEDDCCVQQ